MSLEEELRARSSSVCELCSATVGLTVLEVSHAPDSSSDSHVMLCATCREQVEGVNKIDVHHWHCLNESMWSEVPAVQVLAWRLLSKLSSSEGWASDLLDSLYLEEEQQQWAEAEATAEASALKHYDANGALLQPGDTVTLIKDLVVKGGGFTAKRGTPVRNVTLVHDNAEQCEGRVNGQLIVILTKYVKKAH